MVLNLILRPGLRAALRSQKGHSGKVCSSSSSSSLVDDESRDLPEAFFVVRLRAEVDDVGAEAGHAALAERRAVRLLGLRVHLVHHVHREEELLLRNAALQLGGKARLQDFRRQLTILPSRN